jgi:hypothetical protein
MQPAQLTLGNVKLSVQLLPSGPHIEFTDYETDITWLSGPVAVMASPAGSGWSHIALRDVSWRAENDGISISGRIEDAEVAIEFRLADGPARLVEKTAISNPSDAPVSFELLRIGATWSPPRSWWQYWGYWRLLKLTTDFNPDADLPRQPGQKLSSIAEMLEKRTDADRGLPVALDDERDSVGWILSDDKRFLLMLKDSRDAAVSFLLDVLDSKPSPTLVMGGIGRIGRTVAITPRSSLGASPTLLIPGNGGWLAAISAYATFLKPG